MGTWKAWLDRLWLWTIAIAFVVFVPIWLILRIQDFGLRTVVFGVVALLAVGVWRAWISTPPHTKP